MKRTQIYLTKSQKEALQKEARRKNTTVSELIRKFIGQSLGSGRKKQLTRKKEPTLLEVAKKINALGKKGPKDLAKNLDQYLYGDKSEFVR